jgi:sulfur carrier protein ThiS adenylyltransferase
MVLLDFDKVELSNLNRQLYTLEDIGKPKAEALPLILHRINPFCQIESHDIRVTEENVKELLGECDIVIEAFDVPENKAMLVNSVMTLMPDKYLISGSGMAGYGNANAIKTKKITGKFTVCGDFVTDVSQGTGLTASRVIICAGHMASRAIEIILGGQQHE